jgi:hypothetical protein
LITKPLQPFNKIGLQNKPQTAFQLRMGVLNLVHELMHSFGAKHDPDQTSKPGVFVLDLFIFNTVVSVIS